MSALPSTNVKNIYHWGRKQEYSRFFVTERNPDCKMQELWEKNKI